MSSPAVAAGRQPVSRLTRRIFLAGVIAQIGIVVTGGLVRLSGSGLGCDTWPRCDNSSWTPHAASSYHAYIEFGNRTIAFVASAIAGLCVIAAYRHRPRRKDVLWLAWAQVFGIVAQAVLGGLTVLADLNPILVASHLLLSMVMIVLAVALYERGNEGDGPKRLLVRREVRWVGWGTCALVATLLAAGTVVTGAGPHAGDVKARRFSVNVNQAAWLHADLGFLVLGGAVALALALRVTDTPARIQHRVWWLIGVLLPQGTIGYVQYFNGLPGWMVLLHMLGAALVTATAARVLFGLREREDAGGEAAVVAQAARTDDEKVPATSY